MLKDAEKNAIRESWRLMTPVADTFAEVFVERLARDIAALADAGDHDRQTLRHELLSMLGFAVKALEWDSHAWRVDVADEDDLFMTALAWGRGRSPLVRLIGEHYSAVGDALLAAFGYVLGAAFDDRTRVAWSRLYTLLANALRMGRLSAGSQGAGPDLRDGFRPAPRGVAP